MHLKSDPGVQMEDTTTYPEHPRVEAVLQAPLVHSETYRLYGFSDTIDTPVLAALFGEMVTRANPVVKAYHGDLFHDARWLDENVTGPCEFLYMVREYGTVIGPLVKTHMAVNAKPSSPAFAYRVTLFRVGGEWSVRFDTLNYGSAAR